MKIEQAIKTAIEYENRVCDVYAEAVRDAPNDTARRVFSTLADEEKGHVDFLEHCLASWNDKGVLSAEGLTTAIPSRESIRRGVRRLEEKMGGSPAEGAEVEMLQRALEVEVETSAFYAEMVGVLPEEGKRLFERFVEIEEGHKAIVQAEIDSVSGLGFWFDFQEFDLETE
jgi:rubrerythrin